MALGENGFINIRFAVKGQREVTAGLTTFGARIASLAPAWEQVGEDLLQDFTAQFDAQGGTFGAFSRWAPLRNSTIIDRLRKGFGFGPILERTGQLRQSVTERMAPGNIFLVGDNTLTVGTYTPYAIFHQEGTTRATADYAAGAAFVRSGGDVLAAERRGMVGVTKGGQVYKIGSASAMPARPIIGLSWQRRSQIVRRLGDYVREQARAAGLQGSGETSEA